MESLEIYVKCVIIGDFAPTGVSWPKISGRRGRPPPNILLLRKLG